MGKFKDLDLKVKEFLQIADELNSLVRCLKNLGLFPFMIDKIEGKILDKIENARQRLPKFTKKECEIILEKHKFEIIKVGICLCGGTIRKLENEWYCLSCGKLFYEE